MDATLGFHGPTFMGIFTNNPCPSFMNHTPWTTIPFLYWSSSAKPCSQSGSCAHKLCPQMLAYWKKYQVSGKVANGFYYWRKERRTLLYMADRKGLSPPPLSWRVLVHWFKEALFSFPNSHKWYELDWLDVVPLVGSLKPKPPSGILE